MKKYSYLIVFLLLALFVVQAGYYIGEKSPAHDDTNWLTVAWYITHYWTWQGDYHVLMHPPLSFYMHGIPLRLLEWWQQRSSITPTPPEGTLAAQFPYPYSAILKYDTVFTIAKISMLPWMLLLGWYIYRWATQLYGMYAGLFALSLYVFNPFLIAYSTILSTDMTIVCFTFLATYYFWRFCQDPSYQRAFVSGITVGLALLARASGVLLFPIFCILGLILWLYRQYSRKHSTALDGEVQTLACEVLQKQTKVCTPKRIILSVIIILCIALFVLEAGFLSTCSLSGRFVLNNAPI